MFIFKNISKKTVHSQQLPVERICVFEGGAAPIAYVVRRGSARRKRLAIRVLPGGVVEVVLPPRLAESEAERAVRLRANWIRHHVLRLQELPSTPPEGRSGETWQYLGAAYTLDVLAARGWQGVSLAEGRMVVSARSTVPKSILRVLTAWYRERSREVFAARFAALIPHIPWLDAVPSWSVRLFHSRWGSCSPTGHITLNLNLVKTPLACIDYVILHEVAHLRECNHSPAFYAELEALLPTWREQRQMLRQYRNA